MKSIPSFDELWIILNLCVNIVITWLSILSFSTHSFIFFVTSACHIFDCISFLDIFHFLHSVFCYYSALAMFWWILIHFCFLSISTLALTLFSFNFVFHRDWRLFIFRFLVFYLVVVCFVFFPRFNTFFPFSKKNFSPFFLLPANVFCI